MIPKPLVAMADAILPKSVLLRLRVWRSRSRGDNPELELLPRLEEGGSFIDIGANIGDYSRVAALHFRGVEAFEPIPELAAALEAQLPGHAKVHQMALSDTSGEARLRVPIENGAQVTGLASLVHAPSSGANMREITVRTARLDQMEFEKVDVIKVDVEGFEEAVLAGCHAVIARHLPALIVEIEDRHHPGATLQVFEPLWRLGYRSFVLRGGDLSAVSPEVPHWAGVREDQSRINRHTDGSYVNNFIFLHPDGVGRALAP